MYIQAINAYMREVNLLMVIGIAHKGFIKPIDSEFSVEASTIAVIILVF